MKYAIPLGAILLVGIAAGLHRSPARPAMPDRPGPEAPAALPAPEDARPVDSPRRTVLEESRALDSAIPTAKPGLPAAPAPWQKLFGPLDRALGLTATQRASVEGILRDRDAEIDACHEAIRKAGFVDIRHYDWQCGVMKAGWYRRIDGLLDGVQHEQFVALLQKGFLNEGLAFTIEPGMTVLD